MKKEHDTMNKIRQIWQIEFLEIKNKSIASGHINSRSDIAKEKASELEGKAEITHDASQRQREEHASKVKRHGGYNEKIQYVSSNSYRRKE